MNEVRLPGGEAIPVLGQGTWMMAERGSSRTEEIAALQAGIEAGMTLIDTAEIYGNGASEELVGEAVRGRRDGVFLVSKVAPHHASRAGTRRACEASLKRLGTDRLDLYLLHWPGQVPLQETVEALCALQEDGLVRHWGVSNFDVEDMEDLFAVPGGEACAVNQILYNLEERGVEFDLLPWLAEHQVVPMAYSPVGQGGALLKSDCVARIAKRHHASAAQVALAFLIEGEDLVAIPKAGRRDHVLENAAAAKLVLSREDRAELDAAFPPPATKTRLAVI